MNRLNFNQMVNKTLRDHPERKLIHTTLFDPDYYESERKTAKIKQAKERLNLDGKINKIIFDVHEQLRELQSSAKSSTTKPKTAKIKPQEQSSLHRKFKSKKGSEVNKDIIDSLENNECKNLSIFRVKALCSDKERVHKSTETPCKHMSYENHKRMMCAVKRQNTIEDMIREHKLLTQDRQSLEEDIFAVRHSLDDLQHRVKKSLRELSKKKTYCECHGLLSTKICDKCETNKSIS